MTKWTEKKIATHTKWSGIGSTGKHTGQPIGQGASYTAARGAIARSKGYSYRFNYTGLERSIERLNRRIARQEEIITDLKTAKGANMKHLRQSEIAKKVKLSSVLATQKAKLTLLQKYLVKPTIKKLSDMPL